MNRLLLSVCALTAAVAVTGCRGREQEADVPAVDQPATPAPTHEPGATLDTVTRDTLTTTTSH
ncbi:MAG: hypothetical protein ACREMA_07430 [Longimicrobiales bacterium]